MKTLVLLAIVLICGCCTRSVDRKPPEPDNLIPKDQMIEILVDMHLAEAILQHKQNRGEMSDDLKYEMYASVFQKYETDALSFENSYGYYQAYGEELDLIYREVLTVLSKMQSETENR